MLSPPEPTLKCSQLEDRFTQSTLLGNGALLTSYPIGLIIADEVMMAGSIRKNVLNYLYSGQNYWTMTPAFYDSQTGNSVMWFAWSTGGFGYGNGNSDLNYMGVRPVISLKSDIPFEGTGSYETPFYIK